MRYAKIQWKESGEPFNCEFNDIYFSRENGLAETEYVFLKSNQLEARFQNLKKNSHFVIAETGFGTGLNFLAVLQLWEKCAPNNAKLSFISCEKHPLSYEDFRKASNIWTTLLGIQLQMLLDVYPKSFYIGQVSLRISKNINLILLIGDACTSLSKIDINVDTWFLDGFSPAKNPNMWSTYLFKEIYRLSYKYTTLSTFTAASLVKRELESQGFLVKKQKGFGYKREMITACLQDSHKVSQSKIKPYFVKPKFILERNRSIAVIGAGMAGCSIAYELSQDGLSVHLFDECDDIAQKSSGNPYGILCPYITADANLADIFYTQGFMYTREYILNHQNDIQFFQPGVLEILTDQKSRSRFTNIIKKRNFYDSFVRLVNSFEASRIAGCKITEECAYYPKAMMVNPESLCKSLLKSSNNIKIFLSHKLKDISRVEKNWNLKFIKNLKLETSLNYQCVIFAGNTTLMSELKLLNDLKVPISYGQITQIKKVLNNQTILQNKGYILPSTKGIQLIGATFRKNNDLIPNVRHTDNLMNIKKIQDIIKISEVPKIAGQRVASRCVTYDHLPMIGGIASIDSFHQQYYLKLQKGANLRHLPNINYLQGLYLLTGFGSKGLCSMLHGAKLLSQLVINGENAAISNVFLEGLHVMRFKVRDFKKK